MCGPPCGRACRLAQKTPQAVWNPRDAGGIKQDMRRNLQASPAPAERAPMRLRQSPRRGFFKACAQQSAAEKGANHAAIQAVEKSPPFRGAERFGNNLTPVRPPSKIKGCAKIPAFQPKATVFLRKHTPLKNRLRPDSYRPFLNESLT